MSRLKKGYPLTAIGYSHQNPHNNKLISHKDTKYKLGKWDNYFAIYLFYLDSKNLQAELDFIKSLSILKSEGKGLMLLIIFSLFPPLRTAEEFGFGNIPYEPENSFSVTYQNLYAIPELQTVRINWLNDYYGIGISHFGTSFYRELTVGGIFIKQIDETFYDRTFAFTFIGGR